ncbi:MAG: NAD(P)H-dependent glycerol-3-phosphate dehydrogenase [Firmicutes bacterium]|nr:NAD(P)H-dependent glycerol-3-phosphate dehydrogenase [Bacillota bacterium]
MSNKAAVIGAGSWGTALAARVLSRNFEQVTLWCRRQQLANAINLERSNKEYLPGVMLPSNVRATSDLRSAVQGKDLLVFSIPSAHLRGVLKQVAPLLAKPADLVNTAKGFEPDTLQRLSVVIAEEIGGKARAIAVLSGPNHAEEVGRDMPSASVISSEDAEAAIRLQDAFFTSNFRVYTNMDIVGVELGGALKNIIALAAGIADGMGFGDNTKAMLMTRGLGEMVRLGRALGADPRTFSGLAGIGDLIATCTSKHSRNWNAGYKIGQGQKLQEVTGGTHMVIEGAFATQAAYKMKSKLGVDMPITDALYRVLFADEDPRTAMNEMMNRVRKHEYEDLAFAN